MRAIKRISMASVFILSSLCYVQAQESTGDASADAETEDTPSSVQAVELGKSIVVRGPLGIPLGEVVDIVAAYDDEPTATVAMLSVESINGEPLEEPVSIAYEWSRPKDVMDLSDEKSVKLRGYQSGKFVGTPETDPLAVTSVPRLEFRPTFVIARRLDAATPADKEYIADLIDQLELEDDDTFMEGSRRFVKRESSIRIEKATANLGKLERAAWPVLASFFSDRRPSIAVQPTSGGHTVGVVCLDIIRRQIISVPEGYPSAKTRIGKDEEPHLSPRLTWGFHPSLAQWLELRRDKTLAQIHADVLEQLLAEEDKIGYPDQDVKDAIRGKLIQHLNELKQSTPITRKNTTP